MYKQGIIHLSKNTKDITQKEYILILQKFFEESQTFIIEKLCRSQLMAQLYHFNSSDHRCLAPDFNTNTSVLNLNTE